MRTTALMLALAACGASAPVTEDVAVGKATPVEVLDAAFVRFEGERRPLEFFLWQVRQRCRAARGIVEELPAVLVTIRAQAEGIGPAWLGDFSTELRKAGVRHIVFGGGS